MLFRSKDRIKETTDKYSVQFVEPAEMLNVDIDIYAPCALGATVNDETLAKLKCKVICGAANNQLADEKKHGELVMSTGILYAPDFVLNAGGIINVFYELEGYNRERAMAHAEKIYDTTWNILQIAKNEKIPTYAAANGIAEARIAAIAKINAVL